MSNRPDDAESPTPLPPRPADPAATTLLPSGAATPTPVLIPPPTPPLLPSLPGYEVLRELGRGGMGVVYQARQIGFNRLVALKMMLSGSYAGDEERERFRVEARAVARLQHPNIVQVYEIGEHEGKPFFSMEFCPGGALDRKLRGTPLPPKEAARLVETLAGAVQAAHDKGVIHRDLKPANVLLAEDGAPKVTDFGLAKKLDEAGVTASGAVMGTPSYMAPEQAAGKSREIGPACDVYALGAILYECLTGRPPFKGPTALDTLAQVLADDPVRPQQLQPKTPRELEAICLKCLEKQPGQRYGAAADLAADLGRWRRGEPVQARPVGGWERALKWVWRHPTQAAVYGLLLAALVLGIGGGGATWLWLRAERARGEAEAAQEHAERAEGQATKARDDLKEANDDLNTALVREQDAQRQLTESAYTDRIFLAQQHWDVGDVKRARDLLHEAGKLQDELAPERRPWELDYFNRAFHLELAVLEGHTREVRSVCFSPDGARVATAGTWDQTARVWDAASGNQLALLKGHENSVTSACFSPDGGRVATASMDQTARLWDAASGKQLAVLKGHTAGVTYVSFSPDGSRLATTSFDGTARLWDASRGNQLVVLPASLNGEPVSFSPDSGRVATMSVDQTARLWDAASGKQLAVLKGHTDFIRSVCCSPDGGRVATAGDDGTARLWDANTGKELAVFKGHMGAVKSVSFSPDGDRIATASDDHTARLWDAACGWPLAVQLEKQTGRVWSIVFTPDGRRAGTTAEDDTARLWDTASGRPLAALRGHTATVGSLAISPDGGRLATASDDGTARLWDAASPDYAYP